MQQIICSIITVPNVLFDLSTNMIILCLSNFKVYYLRPVSGDIPPLNVIMTHHTREMVLFWKRQHSFSLHTLVPPYRLAVIQ